MDVKKQKKTTSPVLSNKVKVITGVSLIMISLVAWASFKASTVNVSRNDILIEQVQHGDLEVSVEGYGSLKSDKLQLITTLNRATVKEIVLKPGATVSHNSVIVRLENPELLQQLESASQELAQINGNLRQLKLNQQRELLNETANISEITARHETASLKRAAQEPLAKKGIVTKLDFKESQLNERQLAKRIDIFQQRNEQLALVHQEAINIQLERIKQQQGRVNLAQSRIDKLVVRAGFDGVLQRLSVELGQSLTAGQEIALIGSVTDLIALIRVPQNQAQQIEIGQKAIIDTRRDKIIGTVVRIDPIVENNTVNIEIELPSQLPASARPQLNVDGTIIAATLTNLTYIKRPANIKANSTIELYRLSDNHNAQLQSITLGRQAGRYIEILAGATAADRFIISDLSNLKATSNSLVIN
ncbi:MAG: HlyD family efflux transporter periplasmic adaptor subunit [Gammaproteobacteria bacterium]|nr:HlyD family efflux transporter periplasmic adaptor subunit [Gammaproteobacteria bacterium]